MAKSSICVYCNIGEHFGEDVLLRFHSFLNFHVHLGEHWEIYLWYSILFLYVPGRRSWLPEMYLLFSLTY